MSTTRQAWAIPGVLDWLEAKIKSGVLLKTEGPDDFNALLLELRRQFPEELDVNQQEYVLNQDTFREKVLEIVWNKGTLESVRNWVGLGMPFERFQEIHTQIPKWMFEQQKRELVGRNPKAHPANFRPGIGRMTTTEMLEETEDVEMPEDSRENPIVIAGITGGDVSFGVINGVKVGSRHDRVIAYNPAYNTQGEVALRNMDALIMTGIFQKDMKRASSASLRTQVARYSGMDFAREVISREYAADAARIHMEKPWDDIVFVTTQEGFLNLREGLRKITHDRHGKPKFGGPIIIPLGFAEEELILEMTRYELAYVTYMSRARTLAERNAMLAQNDGHETQRTLDLKEIAQRKRVTNIDDPEHIRFFNRLRSFFIRQLEEAVGEHCVVVGMGSRYIKLGDILIDLYMVRNDRATETNLARYVVKKAERMTLEDGPMPDLALVTSTNNVNSSMAVVEHAEDGVRGSMLAIQPPVGVDKKFLKRVTRDIVRPGRNFGSLIAHEDFEPGILMMSYVDGLQIIDLYTIDAINNYRDRRSGDSPDYTYATPEYLYHFVDTDPHFGNAWKTRVFCPECAKWLGLGPAVIDMMRQSGLFLPGEERIHGFMALDDGLHGHNFQTEFEMHQHVMPRTVMEAYFNKLHQDALASGDPRVALEKLEEIKERGLAQDRLRGDAWPSRQAVEYVNEMIRPNADFYSSIIRVDNRADVRFVGVGQVLGELYDTRNVSSIIFESGNHMKGTDDGAMYEGDIFSSALREKLENHPLMDGMPIEEIDTYVSAPKYGNTPVAWGRLQVGDAPKEAQWGLVYRAQPSKKGPKGDPIRNAAKELRGRGNFTRINQGRHVIHVSGDIHRYGYVAEPGLTVISCASGTDTDPYGERGFSPNNTGNLIFGIPAAGPAAGPIRIIPITYPWIRDHIADPSKIDWDRILPNPVR